MWQTKPKHEYLLRAVDKSRLQQRYDLKDGASSRVNDAQSLVFAHSADGTAVLVPAHTVDQVWVGLGELVHQLSCAHVPHTNDVVTAYKAAENSPTKSTKDYAMECLWNRVQTIFSRHTIKVFPLKIAHERISM